MARHVQQDLVRQHFPQSSEKDEMLEKVRGSTGQLGFPHWKENRPTGTLITASTDIGGSRRFYSSSIAM